MSVRWPFTHVILLFAATLVAVTLGVAAPVGKTKPKPAPTDDTVTPAIDPAKLEDDAKLRDAVARNLKASEGNLKQIALALHNFGSANSGDLPDDILDKDGKPLLSWRVQLLQHFPRDYSTALYKQFRLNESWDSKHNLELLEKMPQVFASPRVKVKGKGYTVYQVFTGPNALWHSGKARYRLRNVPDGMSNTIFAVEAGKAVPWTKPADIPFDKDKKVPSFGKPYGSRPLCALVDGSVRVLDLKKLSQETLKNAIMPDDGNPLGPDW